MSLFPTPSKPWPVLRFYILLTILLRAACISESSTITAIATKISQPQGKNCSISVLAKSLADSIPSTATFLGRHEIDLQERSSGQRYGLPPNNLKSSRWGVKLLHLLLARYFWYGSDAYDWYIEKVCQDEPAVLSTLYLKKYITPRDWSQQWPCDHCFPEWDEVKLEEHCRELGGRSATFARVVLETLLSIIALMLFVWVISISIAAREYRPFHTVLKGPTAEFRTWHKRIRKGSQNDKQNEEQRKPNKLQKAKSRNKRSLIPIMPPAPRVFPSGLSSSQVDGNASDNELGLLRRPSGYSKSSANRAVSSGTYRAQESIVSRRPSASLRGDVLTNDGLEKAHNASGYSTDPRPLKTFLDDRGAKEAPYFSSSLLKPACVRASAGHGPAMGGKQFEETCLA